MVRPKHRWKAVALLLTTLALALPAWGADGVIEVYDSTFDELAHALEPIRFSSPTNGSAYPLQVTIDPPFFDPYTIKLCDGNWTARVTGVDFTITPSQVLVTGQVSATYTCVVDFHLSGSFNTTADVTYNSTQNQLKVTVNPATVQLKWTAIDIPGFGEISFSRSIRVDQGLQVPPIPVRSAALNFETAEGPELLRLSPYNIAVIKRYGYIELQGDVILW